MLAALTLLAGCAGAPADPATPVPPSAPTTPASGPSTGPALAPRSPSPEALAHDPRAHLLAARVTRSPAGLDVQAWWGCWVRGCRREQAIVSIASDGVATYERGSQRQWLAGVRPERRPPGAPASMDGLLVDTTASLASGIRALVAGGDGATLFPFDRVARSTDEGASWTTYDVPEIGGQRPTVSGTVVLPDGRYLALLPTWSDDRRHDPGAQHHGLWVSDGSDWSSYRPFEPRFRPALSPASGGAIAAWSALRTLQVSPEDGGVIWAISSDDRLYASVDAATTFTELAAR